MSILKDLRYLRYGKAAAMKYNKAVFFFICMLSLLSAWVLFWFDHRFEFTTDISFFEYLPIGLTDIDNLLLSLIFASPFILAYTIAFYVVAAVDRCLVAVYKKISQL